MDITNLWWLENIYTGISIFAIFVWVVSIIWVAKDISARTNSTLLQIISILLVTFLSPIIWLPIYHAIKPIWYKRDKTPWREACVIHSTICEQCWILNYKDHKCCIECWQKLTTKCKECNLEYPHNYQFCSKCGAPNIN